MPQLYKPFHFRSTSCNFFSSLSRKTHPIPMKRKFLRGCLNKWKKMKGRVIPCSACECCRQWALWSSLHERRSIPSDVPKGHLVVYVGENYKRFVIKVKLLSHPLFKALLDQAREEYDFVADTKLCIPCDEHLFLSVIRCASSHKTKGCVGVFEKSSVETLHRDS